MTRQEHLDWCKKRALEYLDKGDVSNAIASMLSDLGKHEETAPAGKSMAMVGMFAAMKQDHALARDFIEGFR